MTLEELKTLIQQYPVPEVASFFSDMVYDGTNYRGWIEFDTPSQAKDFYEYIKPLSDQKVGIAYSIVGFNLDKE